MIVIKCLFFVCGSSKLIICFVCGSSKLLVFSLFCHVFSVTLIRDFLRISNFFTALSCEFYGNASVTFPSAWWSVLIVHNLSYLWVTRLEF